MNFCEPVCASSCVQVLTCAEALTTSGVISEAPSTLIFEKGSLIGLGLAEQASMVSQRERLIPLSPSLQRWVCKCVPPYLAS